MASTTVNTPVLAAGPTVAAPTVRIAAILRLVGALVAGARAGLDAGRLARLGDGELAARGLSRDRIVAHAFRDLA